MPRIHIADLEELMDEDVEYVDKREVIREKEAKNRFKDNIADRKQDV